MAFCPFDWVMLIYIFQEVEFELVFRQYLVFFSGNFAKRSAYILKKTNHLAKITKNASMSERLHWQIMCKIEQSVANLFGGTKYKYKHFWNILFDTL